MKDGQIRVFEVTAIVLDTLFKYILILSVGRNIPLISAPSYGTVDW